MLLTDEMPTEVLASIASEFRHLQIVPAETMFSTTIASEKVKLVEIKNLQELKWCLEGIKRDMLCLIDQRNIISETVKWGQVEDGEVCIIRKIGQEFHLLRLNGNNDGKPKDLRWFEKRMYTHKIYIIGLSQDRPEFTRLLTSDEGDLSKVYVSIREEMMSSYRRACKMLLMKLAVSLPTLLNCDVKIWKYNYYHDQPELLPSNLEKNGIPIHGLSEILSDTLRPGCLEIFVSTRVEELVNVGLERHQRKLVDIKDWELLKQLNKGNVLLTQYRGRNHIYYVAYEYVGNAPNSLDRMYIEYEVDLVHGSIVSNNKKYFRNNKHPLEKGVILTGMNELQSVFRDALFAARKFDLISSEILLKALGFRGQFLGERFYYQGDQEVINNIVKPIIDKGVEESGYTSFVSQGNLLDYLEAVGVDGEEIVLLKGNEGTYFAIQSKEEAGEEVNPMDFDVYLIDFNEGNIRLLESLQIEDVIDPQYPYTCVFVPDYNKLEDLLKVPFDKVQESLK